MKKVLIDLDRLKNINTGLGQVSLSFGKKISELNDKDIEFTFLVPDKFAGYFGNNVKYEKVSLKRRYFPSLCKKYDLWHALHQDSAYFPSGKTTPYILTVHDLNFLYEKSEKKAKKRLKRLQKKIDRATHITVISNFTKNEVLKNLNVKNKDVQIIYNGVEISEYPRAEKPAYVPDGKLLFSIGVIKEKKNTAVLIPFI
ncbi:MAG: glycosyltransferase family 4 protein, partial [Chlorobi bacterium]|nr:glycosyltransferase family 4 protein [Chlorobiota bacterium]